MSPEPGWYPDPSMANTQRYWDGTQWTGHVQPISQGPPAAPGQTIVVERPRSGISTALIVVLVIVALLVLAVGGCAALLVAAGSSSVEVSEVEFTGSPADEPAADSATADGTREAPLPYGRPVDLAWSSFGDADGSVWSTTVGSPRDMTDEVVAANPLNLAPPDGVRYVGFEVEKTLLVTGKEPLSPGFNFSWEILGGATSAAYRIGTIETQRVGCGVVPDDFDPFSEVFVGGTLSGTVCIPIPAEDLDHPDTRVALHFSDDSRQVFGP